MRRPDVITREIQDLDTLRIESDDLSRQFPEDNFLKLNIAQIDHRKQILMLELDKSLEYFNFHSLKYIFSNLRAKVKLETLVENLSLFKTLLDKQLEKVTAGKMNYLPVFFNTTFASSYGIQLSTDFEENLFIHNYENAIDQTMSTISDLTTAPEHQIQEMLEKDFGNDRKLVNRYSRYFKKVFQSDNSVEIRWKSPVTGKNFEVTVTAEKAKTLFDIFSMKETKEEKVQYLGILKGLSLIRYKVEFMLGDEGPDYISAKFDKDLSEIVKDALDTHVIAEFKMTSTYNEAKDDEERKYELVSIHTPEK